VGSRKPAGTRRPKDARKRLFCRSRTPNQETLHCSHHHMITAAVAFLDHGSAHDVERS